MKTVFWFETLWEATEMAISKMKAIIAGLGIVVSSSLWASGNAVDGTVNAIDSAAKKLTISHGPIKNLGMGAMTMEFLVADPAMLSDVKPGQKIKFHAEKDKQGNFVVTDLE